MEYAEQIDKAHSFQDWLKEDQGEATWRGKALEDWIDFESFTKVMFREWALISSIPREYWASIYKIYMRD